MRAVTFPERGTGVYVMVSGGQVVETAHRNEMNDALLFALVLGGWFLLVRVILPRFGVPT